MTITRARAARTGPGGAGLTLAVLSAATFGTSGVFATSLIKAGWSPAAAVTAPARPRWTSPTRTNSLSACARWIRTRPNAIANAPANEQRTADDGG